MKILILYATHGGVTRTCAEILTKRLMSHHTVQTMDIHDNPPSPASYDAVVLGSCIRMGKINKAIKRYIKTYMNQLSSISTGVFSVADIPDSWTNTWKPNCPKS